MMISTPWGGISWDGDLSSETVLDVNGKDIPLQQMISMTNGLVVRYLSGDADGD